MQQADMAAQILACIIPLLAALISNDSDILLAIYLTVGAVQIISCLAHAAIIDDNFRSPYRTSYEVTLFSIFLLFCLVLVFPMLAWLMFYILLAVTPFMAIWYFSICMYETRMLSIKIDREKWI